MKSYEMLSNRTRNLEQQYISEIVAKHSTTGAEIEYLKERIKMLEEEISIKEKERINISAEYEDRIKNHLKREEELNAEILRLKSEQGSDFNNTGLSKKDINEIKASQKDILKNFGKFVNFTETTLTKLENFLESNSLDSTQRKLRIENDTLKDENFNLKKIQSKLNEYKDRSVILKDNLDNKMKIIEEQKKKIVELTDKSSKNESAWSLKNMETAKTNMWDLNRKTDDKKTISDKLKEEPKDPWALTFPKNEPIIKKPKNTNKKTIKNAVNVENLIKDENKSFFNNLSFNNSSPVINEKKIKKPFK